MLNYLYQDIFDHRLPTEHSLEEALELYSRRLIIVCVVVLSTMWMAAVVAIFIVNAVLAIIFFVAGVMIGVLVVITLDESDYQIVYPSTFNEIEKPQKDTKTSQVKSQDNQSHFPSEPSSEPIRPPLKRKELNKEKINKKG